MPSAQAVPTCEQIQRRNIHMRTTVRAEAAWSEVMRGEVQSASSALVVSQLGASWDKQVGANIKVARHHWTATHATRAIQQKINATKGPRRAIGQ